MTQEQPETEKNLSADLKTFEELPHKTKELLLLSEDAEKAIGLRRTEIDKKIKPLSGSGKQ